MLRGKVVAVVGGTGGLGRAVAARVLAEGARVVLTGRSADALADAARALTAGAGAGAAGAAAAGAASASVRTHVLDLADAGSVEAFAAAAFSIGAAAGTPPLFGTLDVVVVTAGHDVRKPLHAHTDADVATTVGVNLTGNIWLARALLLPARKFAGQAVFVGGFSDGRLAFPYYSVDVATRAAMFSFIESVNRELELDGRTAQLAYFCPAPTDTDAERPYHALWKEMGIAVVPIADVCSDLMRMITRRERVRIMGGTSTSFFTALNSVWPSAADSVAMRRFGRILQRHFGSPSANTQ